LKRRRGPILARNETLPSLVRRTRSKRRDAEELFAIAFDQAGIGAGIIGLAGIPIRVNAAVCNLLGRPADELVGRNWDEFHHPEEMPIGEAMRSRGVPGSDTYTDERRFVRPDGSIVWGAFDSALVRDKAGAPSTTWRNCWTYPNANG
jgi:PAS domain S-box-containing protein